MSGRPRVLPFGDAALLVELDGLPEVLALAGAVRQARWPQVLDVVPGARTVLVATTPGADLVALRRTLLELPLDPSEEPPPASSIGSQDGSATSSDDGPAASSSGSQDEPATSSDDDPAASSAGSQDLAVEIPVVYDGPDLEEVGRLTGLGADGVVDAHTGHLWRVAFGGFAPGFAYLAGGDERLAVPRRDEARTAVPAGAVGLAGEFSGVYPRESPGGWQLIGRTDAVLWDLDRDPPALLSPGGWVRFVPAPDRAAAPTHAHTEPADDPEMHETAPPRATTCISTTSPTTHDKSPHRGQPDRPTNDMGPHRDQTEPPDHDKDPHCDQTEPPNRDEDRHRGVQAGRRVAGDRVGRVVEVVTTGPLALVQDLGRPGLGASGVGRSGAADRGALRLANRLVANPEGAAGIEVVFGGLSVRAGALLTVALAGAPAPAAVNRTPVGHHAVLLLRPGQVLTLGTPPSGLRTYLAIRGGVRLAPVLGSQATDVLSRLGPPALTPGTVLPIGPEPAQFPLIDVAPVAVPPDGTLTLRAMLGPRADWIIEPERLAHTLWTASSRSDRVGMRLHGEPLRRATDAGELPSEGMARGAVQVPPNGEPVLFLADHPVTGGYPVVAVVLDADIDRAAQIRPGQPVRFTLLPPP